MSKKAYDPKESLIVDMPRITRTALLATCLSFLGPEWTFYPPMALDQLAEELDRREEKPPLQPNEPIRLYFADLPESAHDIDLVISALQSMFMDMHEQSYYVYGNEQEGYIFISPSYRGHLYISFVDTREELDELLEEKGASPLIERDSPEDGVYELTLTCNEDDEEQDGEDETDEEEDDDEPLILSEDGVLDLGGDDDEDVSDFDDDEEETADKTEEADDESDLAAARSVTDEETIDLIRYSCSQLESLPLRHIQNFSELLRTMVLIQMQYDCAHSKDFEPPFFELTLSRRPDFDDPVEMAIVGQAMNLMAGEGHEGMLSLVDANRNEIACAVLFCTGSMDLYFVNHKRKRAR